LIRATSRTRRRCWSSWRRESGALTKRKGGCQVREAIARHRKRRKRGLFVRPIIVTKDQLDQLEEHGYLNAGDRGTRADECEAIASLESLWPAHRNLPLRNPVAALRTYFEHHVVLARLVDHL
jgi:hypothetical protein